MPSIAKCSLDNSRRTSFSPIKGRQELLRLHSCGLRLHRPIAIVREHGAAPDVRVRRRANEPAKRRIVVDLLHQLALRAHRIESLHGANVYPPRSRTAWTQGFLTPAVVHRVTRHLQQVIESDHFQVKRAMPTVGGFRSFATARRTIAGFEAMLWPSKGLGFAGAWTVRRQNELLALCFGLQMFNEV